MGSQNFFWLTELGRVVDLAKKLLLTCLVSLQYTVYSCHTMLAYVKHCLPEHTFIQLLEAATLPVLWL